MTLCRLYGGPGAWRALHRAGYSMKQRCLKGTVMDSRGYSRYFYGVLEVVPHVSFYNIP